MRSVAEIDKDIAEVKARMASENPQRTSPEYRAARFDYIVNGDRSGLDAYQTSLQAAIQNKLQRESSEKMMQIQQGMADDDQRYQWRKDYALAQNALREVNSNPTSSEKDKADAQAYVDFYEDYGTKKGWMQKPVSAPATVAPVAQAPATATVETVPADWQNVSAKAQGVIDTDTSTPEDIDAAIASLKPFAGNTHVAEDLAKLNSGLENKRNLIETTKAWEKAQEKANSEIDRKGVKIADLTAQKKEIEKYKDQKGYDTLVTKLDNKIKALTPPDLGPIKTAVKQKWTIAGLRAIIARMRREGKTEQPYNINVNEKTVPVKVNAFTDGSGTVTTDKGKVLLEVPFNK